MRTQALTKKHNIGLFYLERIDECDRQIKYCDDEIEADNFIFPPHKKRMEKRSIQLKELKTFCINRYNKNAIDILILKDK